MLHYITIWLLIEKHLKLKYTTTMQVAGEDDLKFQGSLIFFI
jgi:hypothetical protein